MSGWSLFLSVFGIIFIAELPDKTALAALVLATRHKPLPVLLGAASALTIQSAVAVGAGHIVSLLPERPVHVAAGLLFLVTAALMWRRHDVEDEAVAAAAAQKEPPRFLRSTWTVFAVVFVAEWGDLTQLATAALAAHYRAPFTVFAGSTAALWAVAGIAVFIGHHAGKLLDPNLTKKIAAVLFAAIGIALVTGAL